MVDLQQLAHLLLIPSRRQYRLTLWRSSSSSSLRSFSQDQSAPCLSASCS